MTVEDLVVGVYEESGMHSELYPYDDGGSFSLSTSGATKILGWINRAYKRVVGWKYPNGTLLRFRNMVGTIHFQMPLEDDTATAGATATITFPTGFSTTDDYYVGWIVEIDGETGEGQRRYIVDYDGDSLVATVSHDWDTEPDSTSTILVYKNFMRFLNSSDGSASVNVSLDMVDEILAPLSLVDLKNRKPLTMSDRTETFSMNMVSPGTPTQYVWEEDGRLVFDKPVSSQLWYKLEYAKMPAALSDADEEPQIPEFWHEAIFTYAMHLAYRWTQEFAAAYALKRDMADLMSTLKGQIESSHERQDYGMTMGRD